MSPQDNQPDTKELNEGPENNELILFGPSSNFDEAGDKKLDDEVRDEKVYERAENGVPIPVRNITINIHPGANLVIGGAETPVGINQLYTNNTIDASVTATGNTAGGDLNVTTENNTRTSVDNTTINSPSKDDNNRFSKLIDFLKRFWWLYLMLAAFFGYGKFPGA